MADDFGFLQRVSTQLEICSGWNSGMGLIIEYIKLLEYPLSAQPVEYLAANLRGSNIDKSLVSHMISRIFGSLECENVADVDKIALDLPMTVYKRSALIRDSTRLIL